MSKGVENMSEKILIIDDEQDIADLLEVYLKNENYVVYKRITAGIQCSYSKKAYPWDNACIESFHSLIKREWLNRFKIRDYDHAYRLVFEYLEAFYNTKRIHSHCDYMSPNDYEELYRRIQKDEFLMAS